MCTFSSAMERFGFTPDIAGRLATAGIGTPEAVLAASAPELAAALSAQIQEAEQIQADLASMLAPPAATVRRLYREACEAGVCISTGFREMDALLGGGLHSGDVIELAGPCSVGKTQLCHALTAAAAACGHSVAFLDTTASFAPERLLQLLEQAPGGREAGDRASGAGAGAVADLPATQDTPSLLETQSRPAPATPTAALAAVRRFAASDIYAALRAVDAIGADLRAGGGASPWAQKLRLVVLDSANTIAAPLLGGRQRKGARSFAGQLTVATLVRQLSHLAAACHVAVVVVNATLGAKKGAAAGAAGGSAHAPQGDLGKHVGTAVVRAALGSTWPYLCRTRVAVSRWPHAEDGELIAELRAIKLGRSPDDTRLPDAAIPTAVVDFAAFCPAPPDPA